MPFKSYDPIKSTILACLLSLPVASAMAATPKDTVVFAKQIDDIISLDPAESFEFSGTEINGNVYDRLLVYDLADVRSIQGKIAASWSASPDGQVFTFKIRPGLKFHSGNPVTAEDAAYSLQRAVILNKSPGFILTQFGFTKDNASQRIRATDSQTLVLETAKPVAPTFFYYCLTANVAAVVDSKLVKQHEKDGDFGNEYLKTNSAASGPYRLRGWKANESVTLEANKDYWGGAPKNARVVIRHVKEPASQRLELERGDIDYARNLNKDQLDGLLKNSKFTTQSGLKGAIMYVGLNQKNPNLAKPEVREALKWLTDYAGMERNLVSATYRTHQSFLPHGFLGAIDDTPYKFDLAKGKELLAKAGLPNGFSMTMDTPANSPFYELAQALQSTWGQAGVKVDLIQADARQLLTKYRARNHDALLYRWGPDYQDPHTNAETFSMNIDNSDQSPSKTLAWRNSWDIPDLTERTKAAVVEQDQAKREAIYVDLQREHMKISPFIIMFQEIEVAAHPTNIEGFIIGPGFDTNFYAGIVKK